MHFIGAEVKIPPRTQDEGVRVFYPRHFVTSAPSNLNLRVEPL